MVDPYIQTHQTGSALIISLIILILMTLIGSTAMQTTVLEEKMAGNNRDLNVAFQAGEAGLRDAEEEITPNNYLAFTASCVAGLCLPSTTTTPQWLAINWAASANQTRCYGSSTSTCPSTPEMSGTAAQPRYIIERMTHRLVRGRGYPPTEPILYRITGQGFGAAVDDSGNPLARVMLQITYRK